MISYKVKLLFNSLEDKSKLIDLLTLELDVWNSCSKMVFDRKLPYEQKAVHKSVYYELRGIHSSSPSQLVIRVIKDVISKYRSAKSNKHIISKPFTKECSSLVLDKRLYVLKNNKTIRLTTLDKRIEVNLLLYPKVIDMFSKYQSKDPTISIRNNTIFLSFPFETPSKNIIMEPLAVGIDLGINNLASTSEGIIYEDKNYLSKKRSLRYLKRQLSKANTKSANKHKKKIRRKESNRTKNYIHNLCKKILLESKGNVIVLENLSKIKINTKKSKAFNNKHSQIPYYLIKQILTYKATLFGKKVVTVNPSYTSQIDSLTGLKDGERIKGKYVTKDGKQYHSDINASINIAKRSKLPISVFYEAIYGQGVVSHPIVCKSSH